MKKDIEIDTYDPVIERCADGGFAKELVKNVRLSDGCDSYIVVTADADAIPAIAEVSDKTATFCADAPCALRKGMMKRNNFRTFIVAF